jgi:hypothetical protein
MDALSEAKQKKIIRAHGFSAHTHQGLETAAGENWVECGLVRINPQGVCIDTTNVKGRMYDSKADNVKASVERIKKLHERKIGLIGMKLIGNGKFTNPEDREKSIRFAMNADYLDAVVIGFKNTAEIDEAVKRINSALAASV